MSLTRVQLTLAIAVLVALMSTEAHAQEVFFGNLHSHTSISDGSSTPRVAYRHARDVAELDFLAITEHNHAGAASRLQSEPELYNGSHSRSLISEAARIIRDDRFVGIFGQEFSSIGSGNHANVLEVGEVISTTEVPNGRWDNLINTWLPAHLDSAGQGAIILLNHPTQSSSPNDIEYGIDDFADFETWRSSLDAHAQLINIINGPSHDATSPGSPSQGEFLRYLNLGLHVAPTADQDNHRRNWGSAAETRSGVIADSLTKANILAALRARHVYATEDRNLRIIATFNGQLIGSRITGAAVPAVNTELNIQVSLADDDEPNAVYTIDVFADVIGGPERADVIAQFSEFTTGGEIGNGDHQLSGIHYTGGQQYFFLRVSQSDPDHSQRDRAWLAPVWFEPAGTTLPASSTAVTLSVNLELKTAAITNVGSAVIDLQNWQLISTRGNQVFTFPNSLGLAPGSSIVVASGPNAADALPAVIAWGTAHIWTATVVILVSSRTPTVRWSQKQTDQSATDRSVTERSAVNLILN